MLSPVALGDILEAQEGSGTCPVAAVVPGEEADLMAGMVPAVLTAPGVRGEEREAPQIILAAALFLASFLRLLARTVQLDARVLVLI
jgi:hypothetical protein